MIDWLGDKLGTNILVKISGKTSCLKCYRYIQYAISSNGIQMGNALEDTPVKNA
jgi:hypothetical protein